MGSGTSPSGNRLLDAVLAQRFRLDVGVHVDAITFAGQIRTEAVFQRRGYFPAIEEERDHDVAEPVGAEAEDEQDSCSSPGTTEHRNKETEEENRPAVTKRDDTSCSGVGIPESDIGGCHFIFLFD